MQIKIKISFYFYEITKYFFFFCSSKTEQKLFCYHKFTISEITNNVQAQMCHFCQFRFYQFQREFICNIYYIDFLQKTNSPLKPTFQ